MRKQTAPKARIFTIVLTVLLATALVSGCAGAPRSESALFFEPGVNSYDTDMVTEAQYAPAEPEAPAAAPAPAASAMPASMEDGAYGAALKNTNTQTPDYGGHKVIRTIAVRFETDAFDADYQALLDRAATLGGYVEGSSVEGRKPETYRDSGRYAYLTFRIPSDKVDSFAANAKTFGTLLYYNENAEDITDRYFDSETRLDVLKIQLERLTGILTTSSELSDIIELEREIADVTLQIEELTSELRRYDGLIGYSTVNVEIQELSLSAGPAREKTTGERINEGFTETLYDVGTFFVDLAVWFVSALPILLLLAAIAFIIILIIRKSVKRSRARAEAKRALKAQSAFQSAEGNVNNNNQGENKNE